MTFDPKVFGNVPQWLKTSIELGHSPLYGAGAYKGGERVGDSKISLRDKSVLTEMGIAQEAAYSFPESPGAAVDAANQALNMGTTNLEVGSVSDTRGLTFKGTAEIPDQILLAKAISDNEAEISAQQVDLARKENERIARNIFILQSAGFSSPQVNMKELFPVKNKTGVDPRMARLMKYISDTEKGKSTFSRGKFAKQFGESNLTPRQTELVISRLNNGEKVPIEDFDNVSTLINGSPSGVEFLAKQNDIVALARTKINELMIENRSPQDIYDEIEADLDKNIDFMSTGMASRLVSSMLGSKGTGRGGGSYFDMHAQAQLAESAKDKTELAETLNIKQQEADDITRRMIIYSYNGDKNQGLMASEVNSAYENRDKDPARWRNIVSKHDRYEADVQDGIVQLRFIRAATDEIKAEKERLNKLSAANARLSYIIKQPEDFYKAFESAGVPKRLIDFGGARNKYTEYDGETRVSISGDEDYFYGSIASNAIDIITSTEISAELAIKKAIEIAIKGSGMDENPNAVTDFTNAVYPIVFERFSALASQRILEAQNSMITAFISANDSIEQTSDNKLKDIQEMKPEVLGAQIDSAFGNVYFGDDGNGEGRVFEFVKSLLAGSSDIGDPSHIDDIITSTIGDRVRFSDSNPKLLKLYDSTVSKYNEYLRGKAASSKLAANLERVKEDQRISAFNGMPQYNKFGNAYKAFTEMKMIPILQDIDLGGGEKITAGTIFATQEDYDSYMRLDKDGRKMFGVNNIPIRMSDGSTTTIQTIGSLPIDSKSSAQSMVMKILGNPDGTAGSIFIDFSGSKDPLAKYNKRVTDVDVAVLTGWGKHNETKSGKSPTPFNEMAMKDKAFDGLKSLQGGGPLICTEAEEQWTRYINAVRNSEPNRARYLKSAIQIQAQFAKSHTATNLRSISLMLLAPATKILKETGLVDDKGRPISGVTLKKNADFADMIQVLYDNIDKVKNTYVIGEYIAIMEDIYNSDINIGYYGAEDSIDFLKKSGLAGGFEKDIKKFEEAQKTINLIKHRLRPDDDGGQLLIAVNIGQPQMVL